MKEIDRIKLLKPTAKAIFKIAKELNMVDKIYNELVECSKLFQDEDITKYFVDRSVPKKNQMEIIENKLKPIFSKASFYKEISDEDYNIVRVRIITADEIDKETVDNIIKTVECFSNGDIVYTTETDKDIIGGIIVHVDSVIYDYSVKNQVNRLQDKFINSGGNKIFKIF